MFYFGRAGSPRMDGGKQGIGRGAGGAHLYSSFQTFPVIIVCLYATSFKSSCLKQGTPHDTVPGMGIQRSKGLFPKRITGICGLKAAGAIS